MYKGIVTNRVDNCDDMSFFNSKKELPLYLVKKNLSLNYSEAETIYLMKSYCLYTKNEENMRFALEFLYMNGFYRELRYLIEVNKLHKNPLNRSWAFVYELLVNRIENRTSPLESYEMISQFKTDDPYLKTLLALANTYIRYQLKDYNSLGVYLDFINEQLDKIDDTFIQELFDIRRNELLFHYHWKRNEVVLARKHGFKVINDSFNPRKQCDLHIYLSQTYIFEGFSQSMGHLIQAKQIAEKYHLRFHSTVVDQHTIPFTCAIFGQAENICTDDLEEHAHLLIAKGEMKKAIEILEGFKTLTPFRSYYLGIAKQDKNLLNLSYQMFINNHSDYFYARLPLKSLKGGDNS